MSTSYQTWIDAYVAQWKGSVTGMCSGATRAMQLAFPELKRVRGWCTDATGEPATHWWCVAPDGSIVDPTAAQFTGPLCYEELDEAAVERGEIKLFSGHCMDCGADVYNGALFCNAECEERTRQYLETGVA